MPIRIYEIAKRLGAESKDVIAIAKELGIAAARVPSSSLDKITAEYLEEKAVAKLGPQVQLAEARIQEALISGARLLDLHGLRLKEFPASIAKLTNLEVINAANNRIEVFPELLHGLTRLEQLYLEDNRITNLPESISNLQRLRVLWLQRNRLSTLP